MIAILTKIFAFLLAVSILVLVHELCHFWIAKRFEVKIVRFSIGLGNPLCKWVGKDKTEYRISSIPLGGYVKMLESNDEEADFYEKDKMFDLKPLPIRALILLAGPAGNILFAILAFWLTFMIGIKFTRPVIGKVVENSSVFHAGLLEGDEFLRVNNRTTSNWPDVLLSLLPHLGEKHFISVTIRRGNSVITKKDVLDSAAWQTDIYQTDPLKDLGVVPYHPLAPSVVGKVVRKSAAFRAGLKKGDRIVSIDNRKINNWDVLVDYIEKRPKEVLDFLVERDKRIFSVKARTEMKYGPGFKKMGYLGVKSIHINWPEDFLNEEKYPFLPALSIALGQTFDFLNFNFILLVKLITGKIPLHLLGGPLTIWRSAVHAFSSGMIFYIRFLAILSTTLAFTNLLPIPGLDGGRLLFLFYEALMRRPIALRYELLFYRLGMIFLVLLIFRATMNDLIRFL